MNITYSTRITDYAVLRNTFNNICSRMPRENAWVSFDDGAKKWVSKNDILNKLKECAETGKVFKMVLYVSSTNSERNLGINSKYKNIVKTMTGGIKF